MFRNIFIFFILFTAFPLISCQHQTVDKNKIQLTVSIIPQKYLVTFIAGDKCDVQAMLPTGSNHETYEPAPRDMEKISSSKLYFALGALDFELTWLDRLKASNPAMNIINTSEGIQMLSGHNHDDEKSGEHRNHGIDPHTWLSPSCMKVQAANISKALSTIDTANASFYNSNLNKFYQTADSVDRLIREKLAGSEGKSILIFHPALAYFARDYNLIQISIEQDGKEPSPAYLAELVKTAKGKGIKAVFISKEFDTRNAEVIAREIKGKVVVFDPMAENWAENLIHLADLIASN
ncbi:MAG: zinc ABC transporter substrate-binding protein [Bacteroidales bacterium]|nr:zinc ABC transporter substrate-binding protein [Bacteroidales bacterium]